MQIGRRVVYNDFQKYEQKRDTRSMDEICKAVQNADFGLMTQQKFLKSFMRKHPTWNRLVLCHQIGSGKTCTAITMAEEFLKQNPTGKVRVILPARLKTNFIEELTSPCGMDKYISYSDFVLYNDRSTSATVKKRIKQKFMAAIEARYDIMSFERFKINMTTKTLDEFKEKTTSLTKNTLVIVDEAHNLLSTGYNKKVVQQILDTGDMTARIPGRNTTLFQLFTKFADETSKFVLLTATPAFDNVNAMREIARAVNPGMTMEDAMEFKTLSSLIPLLRGKVSYFPGSSENSYPTKQRVTHMMDYSKTQMALLDPWDLELAEDLKKIQANEEYMPQLNIKEDKEDFGAFYSYQRQVSLSCLPDGKSIKKDRVAKVIANLSEYAPKVEKCVELLDTLPGKQLVYSNFVQHGLRIVEAALKARGWISYEDAVSDPSKWKTHSGKIYALWDGSVNDTNKMIIKSTVNSYDNLKGDRIRVILGSPSIKEGISFKHMQHVHILDKMWNPSAQKQVEGRAVRYCSHIDIDPKVHKPLRRNVTVHIYHMKHPKTTHSVDDIMQIMSDRKFHGIHAAELLLQKVSIDYHLFKRMYREKPISPMNSRSSIEVDIDIALKKPKNQKAKKCPKKRRPIKGVCQPGHEVRMMTNSEEECCYKLPKSKQLQ